MPKTRKSPLPKEIDKAVYNLTLQNNAMMRRLINNPLLNRKTCLKIESILGYIGRLDAMSEAERAEIVKEAEALREHLQEIREARPLMH